jgi:hypothetical protein
MFLTAVSIHTSRGFSGYKQPSCSAALSRYRFLGPSISLAVALTVLWGVACLLQIGLLVAAIRSLTAEPQLAILSGVLLSLSLLTLSAVLTLLRIDCRYDPD